MDPNQNFDFNLYLEESCTICSSKYKKIDSKNFMLKIGFQDIPPTLLELCPTCIAKIYLENLDAINKDKNTYKSGKTNQARLPSTSEKTRPITTNNSNQPAQVPVLNGFTKSLAVIFSVVSILILSYSLLLKYFPQITLPVFPFYPYVVVFSFLTFFIRFKQGPGFIFLFIIIANFVTPQFRNLFYSYFESPWTKILFTLLFINSFVSLTNLFYSFYLNSFLPKWGSISQSQLNSGVIKAYIPTLILYFAVMSPFFLGAIKPGGDPSVKVDNVQRDPIFDALTTLTKETADVEIARQYFNDGKEAASLGTIEELNNSIHFYQLAIELVPKFSTAYAEIAYSYGALYRIKNSIDKKSEESKTYLNKARVSLDAAKEQNSSNYTVYAVKSIIDFQSGNKKAAKADLAKAIEMSGSGGTNERLLQAMALNEKSEIKSLNYLITIKDKINPNSSELFNLLAVKYYKIGVPEKTKEMAERAILLSPKYDEPYFNFALVAKKRSEMKAIYNKIIEMKSDYSQIADHFKDLLKWQFVLKIVFCFLIIFFWLRFSVLAVQVNQGKENPEKLGLFLIRFFFFCTLIFGSFELYIHWINPVNSLTHLFPTSFPIF
jgi:tetratricopeptide (TPR) repeat protein